MSGNTGNSEMKLPKTPASRDATVKRLVPGHYDKDYNWVEATEATAAAITNASFLPKSGYERATELQTKYESEYVVWVGKKNISFTEGYSELKRGDLVEQVETVGPEGSGEGGQGKRFRIVFPGDYGPAYQVALKEELEPEGDGS